MALKKRTQSKTENVPLSNRSKKKWLDCKDCGEDGGWVSLDIKNLVCSTCTQKTVAPPEERQKPEEKRPRGWQFMSEYISPSGKIYHKGKEVDANEHISSDSSNVDRINKKARRAKTKHSNSSGHSSSSKHSKRIVGRSGKK